MQIYNATKDGLFGWDLIHTIDLTKIGLEDKKDD